MCHLPRRPPRRRDAPHGQVDARKLAARLVPGRARAARCSYMPVQWAMPCLQWAAGEKMCHLLVPGRADVRRADVRARLALHEPLGRPGDGPHALQPHARLRGGRARARGGLVRDGTRAHARLLRQCLVGGGSSPFRRRSNVSLFSPSVFGRSSANERARTTNAPGEEANVHSITAARAISSRQVPPQGARDGPAAVRPRAPARDNGLSSTEAIPTRRVLAVARRCEEAIFAIV